MPTEGGQTQQAKVVDQPGSAVAHSCQQRDAEVRPCVQQEDGSRSSGSSVEAKPAVEDVLRGVGAQFDAYHDAIIDQHCIFCP
jgi:hypothetical protein